MRLSFVPMLFFFTSCSDESTAPPAGTATVHETHELFSTNFEGNGTGAYQGWLFQENDGLAQQFFTFSPDVPENGGSWSLCILPDPNIVRHINYKVVTTQYGITDSIGLQYNLHTVGDFGAVVSFKYWSGGQYDSRLAYASLWNQWGSTSVIYNINDKKVDSIIFEISMAQTESGDTLFIDNFKANLITK